jgi:TRAP transporter TAXI family solute receptor
MPAMADRAGAGVRARLLCALLAVLLAGTSGCAAVERLVEGLPGPGPDAPPGTVTIATGNSRGVYYRYGTALAKAVEDELPGVRARVQETEGSVDNLRRVAAGRSTVAFTAADAASDAVAGREPFGEPLPIRAIARVYDDYVHLVVRAGSSIRSAADLRGQRVSVGPAGSGTEIIASRVLDALGLRRSDLAAAEPFGLDRSVDALRDRRIDAFFWSGGLPTVGVTDLARTVPIRLVPLADLAPAMRRFSRAYRAAAAPAETYPGMRSAVQTLAVPDYLVTHADADPALVYQLTRLLFGARKELEGSVAIAGVLDIRAAIETSPVALHPGALRYYRDTKI